MYYSKSNKSSGPSTPKRFGKEDPWHIRHVLKIVGLTGALGGLMGVGVSTGGIAFGIITGPTIPIIAVVSYFLGIGSLVTGINWPIHAPSGYNTETYPAPTWLSHNINIGYIGRTSSGKSSNINTLLERKAAATGIGETTLKPTKYIYKSKVYYADENIILWDCPGYGTENFAASDKYILEMGLRYFSIVVLCISDAINELDQIIINHLIENKIPFIVVRTKMDECFRNEKRDHDKIKEQVALELVEETSTKLKIEKSSIFLLTSNADEIVKCNIVGFGWLAFLQAMTQKIKIAYGFDLPIYRK